MAALTNPCHELAQSKPLFVTVYASVIVGVVVSSIYVFSAVFAPNAAAITTFTSSPLLSPLSPLSPLSTGVVYSDSSSLSGVSGNENLSGLRAIWEAPEKGKGIPGLEEFRLRKELVMERAKGNVIVVTFGNYAFMDFILTWVKHLTDLGVSNLLVGHAPNLVVQVGQALVSSSWSS